MHYHAGHNMPGYMSMDDDPTTYATFDDAKASMIEDLDRAGDHIYDGGQNEDERAIADEYSAAMEDLNLSSGPEWSTTLPTSTSAHDLGEHYWIVSCTENCSGNPFAGGSNMPDVYGGVMLFAVMDDGGTLCESCVTDPNNPVEDLRKPSKVVYGATGWGVVAFDTTDNVEDFLQCDHCNKVLVEETEDESTVESKCECEGPLHYTTCWWIVHNDDGRPQATGDPLLDYPERYDLA